MKKHVIYWDGDCGFCRRSVSWVLHNDLTGSLAAIPYQEASSPPVTAEVRKACERAVHVLTADGKWLQAGRACLFVLECTKWRGLARILGEAPLVWAVEFGYMCVAQNRMVFSRFMWRSRGE